MEYQSKQAAFDAIVAKAQQIKSETDAQVKTLQGLVDAGVAIEQQALSEAHNQIYKAVAEFVYEVAEATVPVIARKKRGTNVTTEEPKPQQRRSKK